MKNSLNILFLFIFMSSFGQTLNLSNPVRWTALTQKNSNFKIITIDEVTGLSYWTDKHSIENFAIEKDSLLEDRLMDSISSAVHAVFRLHVKKYESTFTYNGANNTLILNESPYDGNNFVFLNGSLLKSSDYQLNTNSLIINTSILTNGAPYEVAIQYNRPIEGGPTINNLPKQVNTYADMVASWPFDDPDVWVEYRVISDETQGGEPSHYAHINNKVTSPVEQTLISN